MSFLRRMFGGSAEDAARPADAAEADDAPEVDDVERTRQLLREDAERTSDDLIARQLRFADLKWTPPSQGGPRRAGDAEDDDAGDR